MIELANRCVIVNGCLCELTFFYKLYVVQEVHVCYNYLVYSVILFNAV